MHIIIYIHTYNASCQATNELTAQAFPKLGVSGCDKEVGRARLVPEAAAAPTVNPQR